MSSAIPTQLAVRRGLPSRWRWLPVLVGTIAGGVVSCSPSPPSPTPSSSATDSLPTERMQVVATNPILCSLTVQIAADTVDLTCLLEPGEDPHTYAPTPSDRQALTTAALILYGGYGFEPALTDLLAAVPTVPQVAVFETAVPNPLLGSAPHDHGHDESAHAHDHPDQAAEAELTEAEAMPDPHIWHNAQHGVAMVTVIAEQLTAIAPTSSPVYTQQATALTEELTALDAWIRAQIATIPARDRILVTSHQAFQYYAQAYGLESMGSLSGVSGGQMPSAAALAAIVEAVKATQAPTIFADNSGDRPLMTTIARDAGVNVAADNLWVESPKDATTSYQEMLQENTCTIVNGLGGQCQL